MKLKEILFVAGQPGLFQFVAQGKNGIIVESLLTHKRTMFSATTKISALCDIAMYTTEGDKPLSDILQSIYDTNKGQISLSKKSSNEELREFMESAVPGYDEDRVHVSDIKKLVNWYNLLVEVGMTDFSINEDEENETSEIAEKKEDKHSKVVASKPAPKVSSQSKAKVQKTTTARKGQ